MHFSTFHCVCIEVTVIQCIYMCVIVDLSGPEAFVADASTRALLAKKNKQRLMSKFSLLVTRLSQRFEELSVNFVRLQTYLTTFGCEYERFVDDVLHQETLPQLFNTVSRHNIWDYLNFDLAGYLVEGFAKSDQMCLDLLADYQRDFTGYLLTTEIVHYIAAKRWVGPTATPPENIPSEELCSKLTVKLTIDITTHSLKYVEEVWKTLLRRSQLPKHTLLLWDIAESSLMITWLFPKSKAAELTEAILGNTHELRLKRVYLVTIDEIPVYLTDLDAINIGAQLDWQDIYEVKLYMHTNVHECSVCQCRVVLVNYWWQLLERAVWTPPSTHPSRERSARKNQERRLE